MSEEPLYSVCVCLQGQVSTRQGSGSLSKFHLETLAINKLGLMKFTTQKDLC